jgi:AraC family transcriptional regulator, regulatory protein of adaptative response / methylated-DNA-[protein]-cysteine methyltransferase
MMVYIISYATGESALGRVLVARSIRGVCAILIGADDKELVTDLAARFPEAKLMPDESCVQHDLAKVARFVDKPTEGLDLPLDLRGTPFQRRVWEALRAIPAGTTVTYSELANSIGAPNAVRAVAGACAPIRSHSPFPATVSSAAMAT